MKRGVAVARKFFAASLVGLALAPCRSAWACRSRISPTRRDASVGPTKRAVLGAVARSFSPRPSETLSSSKGRELIYSPRTRAEAPRYGLLALVFALFSASLAAEDALPDPFDWEESATFAPVGSEGALYAFFGDGLVAVDQPKTGIFYPFEEGAPVRSFSLPASFLYGAAISVDESSLVLVGGMDEGQPSNRVAMLKRDLDRDLIEIEELPSLPIALSAAGGVYWDDSLYIAGGWSGSEAGASRSLYRLNLEERVEAWEKVSELPGGSRVSPALVVQELQRDKGLYVIGGYDSLGGSPLGTIEAYHLKEKQWIDRRSAPVDFGPAVPAVTGLAHVFLYAKDGPSLAYHTITDSWIELALHGDLGRIHAFSEFGGERLILGVLDGVARVQRGSGHLEERRSLPLVDFLVLGAYFAALIGMGYYFSRRGKTTNDYFRGGKRIPGWAAGISIIATKLSAISFMSLPALAYASDYRYLLVQVTQLVAAVFVVKFVLPIFCRIDLTTAYEYLERRFSVVLRVLVSAAFLVFELFKMGIYVFLPSLVLSVMTGWSIEACIITVGVVATLYTVTGGLEAVVWTDVIQGVIMIGGAVGIILVAFLSAPASGGEIVHSLLSYDKLRFFDWSFNLTSITFWVVLFYLPGSSNQYVSLQQVVQRFVSTKNEKSAARSMWITATVGPLQLFLFFMMGTAIFIFYQGAPERLNPTMEQGDQLLAWFIIRELPVGVSGLLIGSIFAASMSSLDSSISSQTTVWITDIYRRFANRVDDAKALKIAKILTLILGALGTISGLVFASYDIKSIFEQFFEILQLFAGGLAGLFFLGIFTTRANARGSLIGYLSSGVMMYFVRQHTDLNFLTFGTIGLATCFSIGYCASLFFPAPKRSLKGLTLSNRLPPQT